MVPGSSHPHRIAYEVVPATAKGKNLAYPKTHCPGNKNSENRARGRFRYLLPRETACCCFQKAERPKNGPWFIASTLPHVCSCPPLPLKSSCASRYHGLINKNSANQARGRFRYLLPRETARCCFSEGRATQKWSLVHRIHITPRMKLSSSPLKSSRLPIPYKTAKSQLLYARYFTKSSSKSIIISNCI